MSVDDSDSEAAPLRLDHFLKMNSISESGGQAKLMIQGGEVKVNGEIETRRRRKLAIGDVVEVGGSKFVVSESDVNR
jgi:ribosome-associated protein